MPPLYLIMNKPAGYVCSAVSDSHKTVYELLPEELQDLVKNAKRGQRLHTIGRLDADTTGLLLFTTDGMFSHKIAACGGTPKIYLATLKTPVAAELQNQYIECAARGLLLPAEKKAPQQKAEPARIEFLLPEQCRIIVTEGKFHEVRRIFKALGNEVTVLQRTAIGKLNLPSDLQPGCYRNMTLEEIKIALQK